MKRILTTAVLACLAGTTPAWAAGGHHSAGGETSRPVEVQGEVVDLHCYLQGGSRGPEHLACAQQCAAEGHPLGLVDDGGKVYRLVPGERQGRIIKLANFGLHHALMCVNMPLEAAGIVLDQPLPQLEVGVHGAPQEPQAAWLAKVVKINGQLTSDGETNRLAVGQVWVLGAAPKSAGSAGHSSGKEAESAGHTCGEESKTDPSSSKE